MADQDPREGNNPEADERPEWLPENFKSPEDLARSYQEAQNKIREQGTQLNAMNENYTALASQIEELQAANQQPVQQQQQQNGWLQMAREAGFDDSQIGVMALLAQNVADDRLGQVQQQFSQQFQPTQAAQQELVATYAEQYAQAQHNDWDEIRDGVIEALGNDQTLPGPEDPRWSNPRFVAEVYDKGAKLYKLSNGVLAPAAQDNREMKLAAQTATGGGSRPETPDEAKAAWERIAGAGGGSYSDLASR